MYIIFMYHANKDMIIFFSNNDNLGQFGQDSKTQITTTLILLDRIGITF